MAHMNMSGSTEAPLSEVCEDGTTVRYCAFPDRYAHLDKVHMAMAILDRVAESEPPSGQCNAYFASLPGGTSFTALWSDPRTTIHYSPATEPGSFADTHSGRQDIALHEWCLASQSHWMIAATLVHELAHACGAPERGGRAAGRKAMRSYMRAHYAETLSDTLDRLRRYFIEVYV